MKFQATDVFGNGAVGSFAAWDHVRKGHPEMDGRENEVKAAIERPVSVHQGNTPDVRVFRGEQIATGLEGFSSGCGSWVQQEGCRVSENRLPSSARAEGVGTVAKKIGKLTISYDGSGDVLYVSVGEPRPAATLEDAHGLLIRKDRFGKTIAVTILDYQARFRKLLDMTWLVQRGLPPDLIHYLRDRPSF